MDKTKYTPMIQQYLSIKENYPDTLIFYRLGDFYELFFDDAEIASRELELVLTGRSAGSVEKIPMCGVPHHSVNGYLEKLIKKGFKIGIVEQLEDASEAKGIVKRDIVQIITPGTLIDLGLNDNRNNYLVAIDDGGNEFIVSYVDLSTGELNVMNLERKTDILISELSQLETKEIVIESSFPKEIVKEIDDYLKITVSYYDFKDQVENFVKVNQDIKDIRQVKCIERLLSYLKNTQRRDLDYIKEAQVIEKKKYLQMDAHAHDNLELIKTIRHEERYGSLLWLLDHCKSAMGSRLLKKWILNPLYDLNEIEERLKIVDSFINNFIVRKDIIESLKDVYDLERLLAKIGYGNANARDLLQLKRTLSVIPQIKELLKNSGEMDLFVLSTKIQTFDEVVKLLETSIEDNPPITIKEGGIIKKGYDAQLDEYKEIAFEGKNYLANIEAKERERTGIKNIKVGYTRVFGYYIEVTNSYLPLIKEEYGYERKQTLTGSERFITTELKEKEEIILRSEEKIVSLEYELFLQIRDILKKETRNIQALADQLSLIDVLSNFAEVALKNKYVRPTFNDEKIIDVKSFRHPVLEKLIGTENFVINDFYMDDNKFFYLITGPNMGGKSTLMKQVALLSIMAQMGSYVPAESASLTLFDKIFTRIGASDDLVSGKSTFMVEMSEANFAISNATTNSLILFDEIGRGTSTYDGMALAQAIIEYICLNVKAKTLFSTHYHELTFLEDKIEGLQNKNVSVKEEDDQVTFLYKLVDGPANKSYGVNVARLAHLPENLIKRAREILIVLEEKIPFASQKKDIVVKEVIPEYIEEVKNIDPLNMSPLEALNYLYELKKKIK